MAAAREAREEVKALVDVHPCRMDHLFEFFQSPAAAYKHVGRMLKSKEIKYEKLIREKAGRPYRGFCNWQVSDDCWKHELRLTDVLVLYEGCCQRGHKVDSQLRPDAELTISGQLHYIEYHSGSMRGRKIEERLRLYDSVDNAVMWIVETENERRKLLQKANENSWFGVYSEIVTNPSCDWLNRDGEAGNLPVRNP